MKKNTVILVLTALICSACTVSQVIVADKTPLDVASLNIAESLLLDIGVIKFDGGVSANNDPQKTGIYAELREAESRYLPYHIKTTLQSTGFWGAVRVVPSRDVFSDVILTGVIKRSDGEYISLRMTAEDITGRVWFERTYSTQTGLRSYAGNRDRTQDPYQKVFNDLANDLRTFVLTLTPKEIRTIRQTSELMFFADMAPTTYGDYLSTDKNGKISLVRLPAESDPMVARLRQIRERDRLVVDSLNEHYANFYYGISLPYESWRQKSRENAINIRQTKRSATLRALMGVAVTVGSMRMDTRSSSRSGAYTKRAVQSVGIDRGIRTIMSAWTLRKSVNLYRAEIGELSESFIAGAAPLTIRVEGETRRLTGTAEAQYESWRKLIKDIYQLETGFSETVDVGVPARAAQPAG